MDDLLLSLSQLGTLHFEPYTINHKKPILAEVLRNNPLLTELTCGDNSDVVHVLPSLDLPALTHLKFVQIFWMEASEEVSSSLCALPPLETLFCPGWLDTGPRTGRD